MNSRRLFMTGSAAALVTVPTIISAQRTRRPAATRDPVLDEIAAQLERHASAMTRGPRGETARHLAGTTRVLAAWATGWDAQVKARLRDVAVREGRDALLAHDIDLSAAARRRRFDRPPTSRADVPHSVRLRIADELRQAGVSGMLSRLAQVWETNALTLDRRTGTVAPISSQIPECLSAHAALQAAQAAAAIFCSPLFADDPAGEAICVMMQSLAFALEWYLFSIGC